MKEAMTLYRAAEQGAGTEGARKRWRLACHALAPLTTAAAPLAAYAKACDSHKRTDWKEAARAMAASLDATAARPIIVKAERRALTLLEFLSAAGGLQDIGGELQGMDAHLWHRLAPFRRKLVNPCGLAMDYAIDLAWERGYFDHVTQPDWTSGDNTHPVTPAMFLDTVRRELAGTPCVPNACEDAPYYVAPEPDDAERLWAETYPESVDAWMSAA